MAEPLCDCGHSEEAHVEPGMLHPGATKVMYEQWCTVCSCTQFVLEGADPEEFDYIKWILEGRQTVYIPSQNNNDGQRLHS